MSRNAFAACEREYNEREERLEQHRETLRKEWTHALQHAKATAMVCLFNYRATNRLEYLNRAIVLTRSALTYRQSLKKLEH